MRKFALAALSAFVCGIAVLPANASVETQTASLPVVEASHLRATAEAHLGRTLTRIDADAKESLRRSMREMQADMLSRITVESATRPADAAVAAGAAVLAPEARASAPAN